MVIETSAVVAILNLEPDGEIFARAIAMAAIRSISAATLAELGIVMAGRFGEAGAQAVDDLIRDGRVGVVPFDAEQAALAREAYRRFGKGNHSAGLNFGDCFAYALAKITGDTLLFKGSDFAQTDIISALAD